MRSGGGERRSAVVEVAVPFRPWWRRNEMNGKDASASRWWVV